MVMHHSLFAVGLLTTLPSVAVGLDVESCLSKLEKNQAVFSLADFQACAEIIRSGGTVGDPKLWARLEQIVLDDEITTAARAIALKLPCEKADEKIASEIVSVITQWAVDLDQAQWTIEQGRDRRFSDKGLLLSKAVSDGLEGLLELSDDPRPILELFKIITTRSRCTRHTRDRCYQMMAHKRVPADLRTAYAVEIIAHHTAHPSVSRDWLALMDRSFLPGLRKIVRDSTDPEDFNYAAAAALADYGDSEILPDLKARRAALGTESPGLTRHLSDCIWRIEAQNPPRNLLEYIASDSQYLRIAIRMWTIRRALHLGVSKADIREAILKFAGRVEREPGPLMLLSSIKKFARDLGILNSTDLADVPEPRVDNLDH